MIGVVLSGTLSDGTAGLAAIKRYGGLAVIEDPTDAIAPDMPLSAQHHVEIDLAVPIGQMGSVLAQLAATRAEPAPEIPPEVCLEATIAAQEMESMATQQRVGDLAPFSCPDCGGSLWEVADGSMLRYRCHVGHAFTAEALLKAESDEVDELEARARSYEENAEVMKRLLSVRE